MFERTLKQLSESALKRRNKKIVIIVDALDQVETDNYKGRSILNAIPSVKYPGVVFLLSTWGEKYLPQQIKNLPGNTGKEVSIDSTFSESEIKKYFHTAGIGLTSDQVKKVSRKTNGLAISLFYLAQKLRKSPKDDYDVVIDSQQECKEVFDWYKPIWNSLNSQQRHCLGCLSFHFAAVQENKLYEITKIGLANFSTLNEKISPFVSLGGGCIEPYHDSFRRYIVSKLKGFKNDYHKERILTLGEIERLLACSNGHTRNIILLTLNTGMRLREILNMKWEDVNLFQGCITLRNTKNNKARIVPMNLEVKDVFQSIQKTENPYVFYDGRTGKPFNHIRTSFAKVLKRRVSLASVSTTLGTPLPLIWYWVGLILLR